TLARSLERMRGELVTGANRLREEIERRAAEQARRTALESQLRHRQRLETVGTFASGVAHEFNNVLVPLLLFTEEAMAELPAGHAARADLERVLAAAERAKSIVSRMLSFTRPSQGVAAERLDLGDAVADALGLVEAVLPPGVRLERHIARPGPVLHGDSTLVHQVVLNLCSNAERAMRPHGGTLVVAVQQVQANGGSLAELRVRDTGHGMTPQVRDRIFEPFFSTAGRAEGAGLGLPVVKGIVTGMGGTIEVTSEVGVGTEFVVRVPLADAPPADPA
ncbi:MAG: hypothetical protein JSR54_14180, partial [Proteobacteria bacterium]|nr:hypothetical protein [Pseudomonadota bacterium]